jgi:hypothetical protein
LIESNFKGAFTCRPFNPLFWLNEPLSQLFKPAFLAHEAKKLNGLLSQRSTD